MNHHITLSLENGDDFTHLVRLIEHSGFRLLRLDERNLEVECYLDNFILSIAEKYLDAIVVYHNSSVLSIHETTREDNLIKAAG